MSHTGSSPPRQGAYGSSVEPVDTVSPSDTFDDRERLWPHIKPAHGQNTSSFRCPLSLNRGTADHGRELLLAYESTQPAMGAL